jgi:hypothetical protein
MIALLVDGHEVPDAVLVGPLAGGDRRPDHRREQRLGGQERRVRALLSQLREVRHLPLGHQEIDGPRVHAVEAEDDHAGGLGPAARGEGQGNRQQRGGAPKGHAEKLAVRRRAVNATNGVV